MKKHISYPKIQQFRNIVSNIVRESNFAGFDEDGSPIYDQSIAKPKIIFSGTVKLHGTNAGICYNNVDGLWIQSRENIITVENDNAGFAFFIESNKEAMLSIIKKLSKEHNIDLEIDTISIFGEWAGQGVQKNVGISQVKKSFFVFGLKISRPHEEDFKSYWLDSTNISCPERGIFNINDFKTYSVEVDFNMPQLSQNLFSDITQEVENECPVSKHFGIDNGLGEGVVWSAYFNGTVHRFKVKGEKHSNTKIKTLARVDIDKLKNVQEFVDYAVTQNRFDQAVKTIFVEGVDFEITKLGDLIRWVINDISSEEMDTMVENSLEPKDVNKYISAMVREMFFKAQKEYLSL